MATKAAKRPRTNTETKPKSKRVCFFCTEEKSPTYTDTISLKKFLSSRGKIVAKLRSGICSRHQRALTKEVKHARHLALLPFTLRI
jgi:small subunit ribosomal protein S18